jgi:RNA polymerase sigma-70 factor, ECF subfamily
MQFPAIRRAAPSTASEPADTVGAGKLFREHAAYVAAFLRRLGIIEASVDDAVQEVFLVAHSRGGYRPGAASARTWLGAITIRVAANVRRARQRRRETADDRVLENHSPSAAPDVVVEQRQELALVDRALRQMSELHRHVFLRFAVAGQSCDDIARAIGVPTGTVYSRLHAARNSLGTSLEFAA